MTSNVLQSLLALDPAAHESAVQSVMQTLGTSNWELDIPWSPDVARILTGCLQQWFPLHHLSGAVAFRIAKQTSTTCLQSEIDDVLQQLRLLLASTHNKAQRTAICLVYLVFFGMSRPRIAFPYRRNPVTDPGLDCLHTAEWIGCRWHGLAEGCGCGPLHAQLSLCGGHCHPQLLQEGAVGGMERTGCCLRGSYESAQLHTPHFAERGPCTVEGTHSLGSLLFV